MIVEKIFNKWILFFLFLIPVLGFVLEEPYYITLTTKVVILGIAGIGLNLALGYCGLISFGHNFFALIFLNYNIFPPLLLIIIKKLTKTYRI